MQIFEENVSRENVGKQIFLPKKTKNCRTIFAENQKLENSLELNENETVKFFPMENLFGKIIRAKNGKQKNVCQKQKIALKIFIKKNKKIEK